MKVFIISLFVSANFIFCQNTESDSSKVKSHQIGFDKVKHTAISCLLTLSGQYILVNKNKFDESNALLYSISASTMVGLTKEINDMERRGRKFDGGDMIANFVGIGIAIFIISN